MNKEKIIQSFKNLKKSRLAIIAAAVVALGAALFIFKGNLVAALVNGQVISRFQLTSELDKRYGKDTLESLIEQTLIFQEAKKENVTVSQKDIDAQIKSIEDSLKSQNVTLADALTARGLTMADLTAQIKIQKIVETILGKKITISDNDLQNYFTQNKSMFAANAKFEDVKEQIKQQLFQEKLNTEYQTWIDGLKAKAKINYFVKF